MQSSKINTNDFTMANIEKEQPPSSLLFQDLTYLLSDDEKLQYQQLLQDTGVVKLPDGMYQLTNLNTQQAKVLILFQRKLAGKQAKAGRLKAAQTEKYQDFESKLSPDQQKLFREVFLLAGAVEEEDRTLSISKGTREAVIGFCGTTLFDHPEVKTIADLEKEVGILKDRLSQFRNDEEFLRHTALYGITEVQTKHSELVRNLDNWKAGHADIAMLLEAYNAKRQAEKDVMMKLAEIVDESIITKWNNALKSCGLIENEFEMFMKDQKRASQHPIMSEFWNGIELQQKVESSTGELNRSRNVQKQIQELKEAGVLQLFRKLAI